MVCVCCMVTLKQDSLLAFHNIVAFHKCYSLSCVKRQAMQSVGGEELYVFNLPGRVASPLYTACAMELSTRSSSSNLVAERLVGHALNTREGCRVLWVAFLSLQPLDTVRCIETSWSTPISGNC